MKISDYPFKGFLKTHRQLRCGEIRQNVVYSRNPEYMFLDEKFKCYFKWKKNPVGLDDRRINYINATKYYILK